MSWRRIGQLAVIPALLSMAACTATSVRRAPGDVAAASPSADASSPARHVRAGERIGTVWVPGAPLSVGFGFGSLWVTVAQDVGGLVARIDPATGRTIATIQVGAFPVGIVAGFGSMWQVAHEDGTVARIDPATNSVTATIPVGPGPAEIAVADGLVWVANRDATVAAVDPATNRRVRLVHVGAGTQFRRLFAGAGSIWTDNTNGGISRIDPGTGTVVATIRIPGCCEGGLLLYRGQLWASNIPDGRLYRINVVSNRVVDHVDVGPTPNGIAIAGGKLWVSHDKSLVVSWHTLDSGRRLGSIKLDGAGFVAVTAADPGDSSVWVQMLDNEAVAELAAG
jgi:YVTN family beta-propeller protein